MTKVFFPSYSILFIKPAPVKLSKNLDNLEQGMLPQKWMGNKILPIYNEAGLDMDYEWQVGQVEWWLKNN